jgi:predicted RNA methylase
MIPLILPFILTAGALTAQLPDAPYEETPPEIVERMLKLADLHPGDVVYDLGCGDGRIVIAAVRRLGVRGVCVELDPARLKWAREVAERAGVAGLILSCKAISSRCRSRTPPSSPSTSCDPRTCA